MKIQPDDVLRWSIAIALSIFFICCGIRCGCDELKHVDLKVLEGK